MMKYLGIETQQRRNNLRSAMLLALFPFIVLALTMVFVLLVVGFLLYGEASEQGVAFVDTLPWVWQISLDWFLVALPWVVGGVGVWFVVAYFFNAAIINRTTHARRLERSENPRVYNLVENLAMSRGMTMPAVNVISSPVLNAYASGINNKTYAVTLTSGIIDTLSDDELEGVIAHELTHIQNRDVRVLIISIVFVGIFTMLMWLSFNVAGRVRGKNSGGIRLVFFILGLVAGLGALMSNLTNFAISRKREFMADAGAAEMTHKPGALASALRKISGNDPTAEAELADGNVAQLFIHSAANGGRRRGFFAGLFSTHPPIEERIEVFGTVLSPAIRANSIAFASSKILNSQLSIKKSASRGALFH